MLLESLEDNEIDYFSELLSKDKKFMKIVLALQ